MAITGATDIAGILEASQAVAATIAGIEAVYDMTGEIPPDALTLPAIVQHAIAPDLPPSTVAYNASQEVAEHFWWLDVLFLRGGDIYAEQAAAMPFIPLVYEVYRENIKLGLSAPHIVHRCLPESHRFVTYSYGEKSFFVVRFQMHAHCKTPVTIP